MISLPVIPYDARMSDLFPEAVVVYGYEKGYGYVRVKEDENMEVGDGYWILFHEDQNHTLTGQPIQSYKKTLYEDGWEMIGGCTFPAQPSTDFCSIDVIYRYVPGIGYERVLESEHIDPGRGYWILYNNIVDQCELRLETIGYSSRIRSLSGSQDISEDIKIRFKKDTQDIKWKMPITATGQVVNSAENVSTVYIGIDNDAVTYPSPGPIPDHTVNMELSGGLLEDYRQSGSEKEVWNLIILIENRADSNLDGFFPRLSWDASETMPTALMELHLGDEYGDVIVDNMKTTSTYQTREEDASTYLPSSNLAIFSYTIVYESLEHKSNHKDVNVDCNKDKKGKNDEFSNWMWIWPQPGYLIQDSWQQSPWINQEIWPLWMTWGKASNLTPEFVWSPLYYQNVLYQQLLQNEAGYQLYSFDL
jgi:hypothetical protein